MTPDVIASTSMSFPTPSDEVFGSLSATLTPGWYAIVFGSGLFNTAGVGGAPRNNSDIGTPSYISFDPNFGWFNLSALPIAIKNYRFVINIVPEPGSAAIALLSLIALAMKARCSELASGT
jgi:hypothetical protein